MNQDLLPYYERELLFIRQMARDFAEKYPDRAAALKLNGHASDDPHVERMIEAFALIAGRIQRKIEDEFPEITEALLGVMYPHYLRPVPSMGIAQFEADPDQGNLSSGYIVPRGTPLYSSPVGGAVCRFRTGYPVQLLPVELSAAEFLPSSQVGAGLLPGDAPYAIRLEFRCRGEVQLSKVALKEIRLFLSGDPHGAHTLYELLFNNVSKVLLRGTDGRHKPLVFPLPSGSIRQVGFGRDEYMLPYSDRSFHGYRLLQEYFAFPEKFLFLDIANLDRAAKKLSGDRFEIIILLSEFERKERTRLLDQVVNRDMFQLGCTPIVNLFERCAEPIRLAHTATEYRVIPDLHLPAATEVYSVDRVTSVVPYSSEAQEYRPFYSFRHAEQTSKNEAFWMASRRHSERSGDRGTEVFLSLLDLHFKPTSPPVESLSVHVTCTNRDLSERLPVSGAFGELETESATVLNIRFLRGPTPSVRPPLRRGLQWNLISHLSLNYLSIVNGSVDALREMLKLYEFSGGAGLSRQIAGIVGIDSRSKVSRVVSAHGVAFCPGVQVELTFDEDQYAGSGVFLLACVLERFFGLYSSLNSFSQLSVKTLQRKGVLREWLPRAGEQIVL